MTFLGAIVWLPMMRTPKHRLWATYFATLFSISLFTFFFFRLPSSCFNFLLVYQIGKFHFTWHHFHISYIISRCCSHVIDTHFLFALIRSLPFRTLLSQLKCFAKSFFYYLLYITCFAIFSFSDTNVNWK